MKKSILVLGILGLFISTQLSAQTKYTRIGVMAIEKVSTPTNLPAGVSQDVKWIVPPVFIESERRLMKYFTLGSEVQFSRLGINTSVNGTKQTYTATSIGAEIQGKVSIPLAGMFEAFAQYGIGYIHQINSSKTNVDGNHINQNFSIGHISNSLSVGGSVIFGESFGVFIETGVINTKSVKTYSDIYKDAVGEFGYYPSSDSLGALGDEHITGKSPFVKIGLVFQIL